MPDEPWVEPPDPVYGEPFRPSNNPTWWEGSPSDPLLSYKDIQRMYLFGLENEGGMSEEFGRRIDKLITAREKKVTMPPPFWLDTEPLPAQPEALAGGELLPPAVVEPPAVPQEPPAVAEIDEGAFPDEVAQGPKPSPKTKAPPWLVRYRAAAKVRSEKVLPPKPKPIKGPPTGTASGDDFTIVDRNRSIYRTYLKIAQRKYGPEWADMAAQMRTLNYDQGTVKNPTPYQLRDIQAMFTTGKASLRAAYAAETGAKTKEDQDLVQDLLVATKAAIDSLEFISQLDAQNDPLFDQYRAGYFGDMTAQEFKEKIKQARLDEYYQTWLDPDKPEGSRALPRGREKIGGATRLHYFKLRDEAERKGLRIQPINDIILGASRGAK